MTDEIQTEIIYGEGKSVQADSYCAKTYADYVIKDETGTYDAVKPLVTAMLHYGAYAQKYFGYNTAKLANEGLAEPVLASVTKDTLTDYKAVGAGTAKVKFYGASLLLKSETTLRFFFLRFYLFYLCSVKRRINSIRYRLYPCKIKKQNTGYCIYTF